MKLIRVALFAALIAIAFAMSSSSSSSSTTTGGGLATLGNIICQYVTKGLKSVKLNRVKIGDACDDGFSFRKRDMSDTMSLMRSLQPELFEETSAPQHPFVQNLLNYVVNHRQRATVDSLTLNICEQGAFCNDLSVCEAAIATGASGCDDDSHCAAYQEGYTGVNCVQGVCLVTEVYGAGESGCITSSDDPDFDGNGCINGDCVSGSCNSAAITEACVSDDECVYGQAYCNSNDVCAAVVSQGQSCTDDNECGSGLLVCAGQPAVCTPILSVGVGGSCADPDGGAADFSVCQPDLICDRKSKTCIRPDNEGNACTTQAECGDGTICAKSYFNCDQICISGSLQSLLGKTGVSAAKNFFTCLANNDCSTPAAWENNCAGKNCLSESAKYTDAVENQVLGSAGGAATFVVPFLALVALVAAML